MKRNVSLNKTVMVAVIALYGILLIFLSCMDLYLIASYQRDRNRESTELLDGYAERIGNELAEINAIMHGIYVNNNYFRALGGTLTELQEFDQSYELDNELRSRIVVEGMPHGYAVYYHSMEKVRYYMHSSWVAAGDIRPLEQMCRALLDAEKGSWQWSFAESSGRCYGILAEKKNSAGLCMIYSLRTVENSLNEALSATTGGDAFFYDGSELFGNADYDRALMSEMFLDHESQFQCYAAGRRIYGQKVKNTNLWICMEIPVTLWSYMNLPQLCLLILTASSLAGMYALYRYMRRELIDPMRAMTGVMKRIQEGEWDARLEAGTHFEELQKVDRALSVMVSEIRKQKMLFYEQTIERQKAQMQYLQLQLKPHFYLNGLKTLHALAMSGDSAKMQDLIIHLSCHLRYLLQAEKELVPLTAEIDYVKNYARLQDEMTGRRLLLKWKVQVQLACWQVPTLCIQTFVENSFKYAKVGSIEKELLIQISVNELETEDGRFLDICVRDNGSGYPEQILAEINDEPAEGCVSVGINNLKRRCSLLYQNQAQYLFYNEDGAVSDLVLPQKCGGKDDNEYTDCGRPEGDR